MNTITIELDIEKSTFHLVWMNESGKRLKKKQLTRKKVFECFSNLSPCIVVMETLQYTLLVTSPYAEWA